MAEDEKFQIGDVVRLKSGGPVMVVRKEGSKICFGVLCAWFDDQKHAQRDDFPEKCLILVEPEKMSALVPMPKPHLKTEDSADDVGDYSNIHFGSTRNGNKPIWKT